MDFVKIRNC